MTKIRFDVNFTTTFSSFFSCRTLLQFAKKKRKRSDSGSDLDMEVTPPPSPKAGDDSLEKRRYGRHTQRKKYVDDVDLNLSEDENLLMNLPSDVAEKEAATEGGAASETKSGTATPKEAASVGGTETPKVPPSDENSKDTELQSGPNYAYVVSTFTNDTNFATKSNSNLLTSA